MTGNYHNAVKMCTPIRATENDVSSENEHKHFGMFYNAFCVRGEHKKSVRVYGFLLTFFRGRYRKNMDMFLCTK